MTDFTNRLQEYLDDHCDYNPELKKLLQEALTLEKENEELLWYVKASLHSYEGLDLKTIGVHREMYMYHCIHVLTEVKDYLDDAESMAIANSLMRSISM